MEQELSLNDLESKIYSEIFSYESDEKEYESIEFRMGVLNKIISYLQITNVSELKDKFKAYDLQLSLIYSEVEKQRISKITIQYIEDLDTKNVQKNQKSIEILLHYIKEEYTQLNTKKEKLESYIRKNQARITEYRKILSNFKYNNAINNNQIQLIEEIMNNEDVSPKNQIQILEQIKNHNNQQQVLENKDTILNMINENIELYDFPSLESFDFKSRVTPMIDSYYQMIMSVDDVTQLYNFFPILKDQTIDLEEFEYIFKKILNKMISVLQGCKQSIIEKDIYDDEVLRNVVIAEYNEMKKKYEKIFYYFDNEIQYYKNNNQQLIIEQESINNLFYAFPPNGRESYLEKDLKDIPKEYLERVKNLLDKLKTNQLNPRESAGFGGNNRLKEVRELRSDQIRILYKKIFKNNYLMLGIGVKKTDNDLNMYYTISNRDQTIDLSTVEKYDCNLEVSSEVEEQINSYIQTNSRKGIR